MVKRSKRFLACIAAALAAIGVAAQPNTTDLLLVNGKVFTADPSAPWAEAVAIHGDRIVAVGTAAGIRTRGGTGARVIDVGGRVIVPGLNDAHTHVGVRPPGVSLKLSGNEPAMIDVLAAIRDAAAATPADRWI